MSDDRSSSIKNEKQNKNKNTFFYPELLEQPVRLAPVHADPGHGLAHRTARLVPDARAARVHAGTPGSHAQRAVHGARAGTRRGTRVVNLPDAVDKAVVVQAPLTPVVPELVIQVRFGREVLR